MGLHMPLLWAFDLEEVVAAGMMAVATWVVLFPPYPYESSQPLSLGGRAVDFGPPLG